MIYLDNAATTIKKPDAVYDAVLDAMKHCGNSGRGASDASLDASRKIYEARMCLTEFSEEMMRPDSFLRQMPLRH